MSSWALNRVVSVEWYFGTKILRVAFFHNEREAAQLQPFSVPWQKGILLNQIRSWLFHWKGDERESIKESIQKVKKRVKFNFETLKYEIFS